VTDVDFDTQRLPGVPARLQTSTKSQVTASHDPAWLKYVVLGITPGWRSSSTGRGSGAGRSAGSGTTAARCQTGRSPRCPRTCSKTELSPVPSGLLRHRGAPRRLRGRQARTGRGADHGERGERGSRLRSGRAARPVLRLLGSRGCPGAGLPSGPARSNGSNTHRPSATGDHPDRPPSHSPRPDRNAIHPGVSMHTHG